MVQISNIITSLATASLIGTTLAHPGETHSRTQVRRDILKRDALAAKAKRGLDACSNTLKARQLDERAITRRSAKADKLRAERGINTNAPFLTRRNLTALEDFETHNHNLTSTYTSGMTLFSSNGSSSCILTPEVTIGPYNIHGELIRSNITEDQAGVPVHLEFQFVNYNTCEGVPDMMLDVWAANATGVYSGVDISGNAASLDTTYLRGLQATDSDGVASFDTIFPGHYAGRAIHQHVVSHYNYTILPNNTIVGGDINHIGQLFFDESLRSAVEATYPYSTNTQSIVSNDNDMWAPSQADNSYDPFPDFVYLDPSDITKGLLMWISVGIDPSANYTSEAIFAGSWDGETTIAHANDLEGL
ncbi:aromatic compound dioxygenase [Acephala macrosclerotiorum]|nr:aromatic compound dioxygenase [Acephala macrosclerotiorum]